MIDLHPQGMFLSNRRGAILRANRTLLKLLGVANFTDVLGRQPSDFMVDGAGCDPALAVTAFLSGARAGTEGHVSRRFRVELAKQGVRELDLTIITSSQASDLRIVLVEDLGNAAEEHQRRERQTRMEAAEATVGALMHRINQPLTVIMIRSQLLLLSLDQDHLERKELKQGLQEVIELTGQIAETLRQARVFSDYVTMPYPDSREIVDLDKSTREES